MIADTMIIEPLCRTLQKLHWAFLTKPNLLMHSSERSLFCLKYLLYGTRKCIYIAWGKCVFPGY
jgi:hypothetical protein